MSNVLIGIIGVILFIGLALAGALFLGPRFQESRNTSDAARITQAMSQMASAASLYRLNAGVEVMDGDHAIMTPAYLKSQPVNPVYKGTPPYRNQVMISYAQDTPGQPRTTEKARYVTMLMDTGDPSDDPRMKSICEAINRSVGGFTIADAPSKQVGCMEYAGQWVAFHKL